MHPDYCGGKEVKYKKYRLKKELPGIPKESIIIEKTDGLDTRLFKKEDGKAIPMLYSAKDHGRLEEIEDKKDTAYNGMYVGDSIEGESWSIGDIGTVSFPFFRKREEAINFAKKFKAMKKVRKRHAENDGDFVPDWEDESQEKWGICYDYDDKEWIDDYAYGFIEYNFLPHFSSQSKVHQCIEDLGDTLDDLLL